MYLLRRSSLTCCGINKTKQEYPLLKLTWLMPLSVLPQLIKSSLHLARPNDQLVDFKSLSYLWKGQLWKKSWSWLEVFGADVKRHLFIFRVMLIEAVVLPVHRISIVTILLRIKINTTKGILPAWLLKYPVFPPACTKAGSVFVSISLNAVAQMSVTECPESH